MNEERYLEIKKFIESYENRNILDKHTNGNKTLEECKKIVEQYENKKNTKICGRVHFDRIRCHDKRRTV